ncbi:MAG: preprotein translocase subunit YajC [Candidatus Marinimicrobia bacterium]|nr:preprotein translocase subunit YajC [Candidatus Neomarinimicrobiota bacterium]MCF7904588.1 preprotein translocase subunit YajC [Candidatus Neomarinimicrobiota bacterium]
MNATVLLMAAPQGGEAGNPILSFLPIILMFVIFYFLLIRPQTKRQKEAEKMRSELKKGDHVITNGGIHGTIEGIKDNDVVLIKTATDTKLHIGRSAIATLKSK